MNFIEHSQQFIRHLQPSPTSNLLWGKELHHFENLLDRYIKKDLNTLLTTDLSTDDIKRYLSTLDSLINIFWANNRLASINPNFLEMQQKVQQLRANLHTKLLHSPTFYTSWVQPERILPKEELSKQTIIIRLFLTGHKRKVFGRNAEGHISLQIGNQYLSFVPNREKSSPMFADRITSSLHIPRVGSRPGRFKKLQEDMDLVRNKDYTEVETVVIDCAATDQLDFAAIEKRVQELLHSNLDYNFYLQNCGDVVGDALRAGKVKLPSTITPRTLFERCKQVSTLIETHKFLHADIPQERSWNDQLLAFNRQLCLLDPDFLDHYLESKDHKIVLPPQQQWFNDAVTHDTHHFVKHVQTLTLGLAQTASLSREDVKNFLTQTNIRIKNMPACEPIANMQAALNVISQRIAVEENTLLSAQTDSLKEKLSTNLGDAVANSVTDDALIHAQKVFSIINIALQTGDNLHEQLKNAKEAQKNLAILASKSVPGFSPKFYLRGQKILNEHIDNLQQTLLATAPVKPSVSTKSLCTKLFNKVLPHQPKDFRDKTTPNPAARTSPRLR